MMPTKPIIDSILVIDISILPVFKLIFSSTNNKKLEQKIDIKLLIAAIHIRNTFVLFILKPTL